MLKNSFLKNILIKDKFIKNSALLFFAMMFGNVFGYLFQLSMGRMLSVEAYGEMNALMSLMIIFGIPFGAFINFFAKQTATYSSKEEQNKIRQLHKSGIKNILWWMVPVLILLSFASPVIGDFLNVSFSKVLMVMICIFLTSIITVNTGIIQGLQYFKSLAVIGSCAHFFRFMFGVLFVWMGFGVLGAIGAVIGAGFVLLLYSHWRIISSLPSQQCELNLNFKSIYKYAGGLFFANAMFAIMTQADLLLVKHYFSAGDAGLYASAAILGKAVMYLPGAIVMAMFPMVAANHTTGKSSFGMLCKALVLTTCLSGGGALVLYLYPEFILNMLFGTKYLTAAPICALFGISMVPVSLLFLLMNYLLAQGKTGFLFLMGICTTVELAGIVFFNDNNLRNILYSIMVAGSLLFVPLFFKVLYDDCITQIQKARILKQT